ncbi:MULTISPECIES: sensor histidine kinase [Streptomycetaceae]|uniref:sensor histidine kinase n=1 Tax=Streptomycetaceae TaxID=2062 RepID=UPI00093DDA98|nr:ATP-binding protein [Streptomyces sp. CB02056]OKI05685.1 histidine kinase [Streptomyces sp. CB02056]
MLYGGLLVLAGAMLIVLVNFLVREGLYTSISTAVAVEPRLATLATPDPAAAAKTLTVGTAAPANAPPANAPPGSAPAGADPADGGQSHFQAVKVVTQAAEQAAQNQLLTVSLIALAAFAVISMALAWWMSGRVLRPVAVITNTARRLSGENLHERIALDAPPGELKQLADTFDDMLDRMEQLVGAQQRFAANAAHELRTPLAVQRAAAEIGLATGDPAAVARVRRKLIEVSESSERLIEGLLLLSVSDQRLDHREPVALDRLARAVAAECAAPEEARANGVTVRTDTAPVSVEGDPVLLAHLVRNLVGNALRYNHDGGRVDVDVRDGVLEVANTGPQVPPETVPYLFEPFRRLQERRHSPREGAGLGLSIVASIARAHHATVTADPGSTGGLRVRVEFPTA